MHNSNSVLIMLYFLHTYQVPGTYIHIHENIQLGYIASWNLHPLNLLIKWLQSQNTNVDLRFYFRLLSYIYYCLHNSLLFCLSVYSCTFCQEHVLPKMVRILFRYYLDNSLTLSSRFLCLFFFLLCCLTQ